MEVLFSAVGSGRAEQYKGFAEQWMSEYDLDGWTTPDLINPDDLNIFSREWSRKRKDRVRPGDPRDAHRSSCATASSRALAPS